MLPAVCSKGGVNMIVEETLSEVLAAKLLPCEKQAMAWYCKIITAKSFTHNYRCGEKLPRTALNRFDYS
jgi:hypothetical protein